jgi:Peptidase C13 family
MRNHLLKAILVVFFTFWLVGCATVNPYEGDFQGRSDALLKQQFDAAEKQRQAKPEGRIIFAGFAMHSQSKAFRNDVITTEKFVQSIDPDAIVFKLNNPVRGQEHDWPYASNENISRVIQRVTRLAGPQDKVVLLFSTHGHVNILSNNFNNQYALSLHSNWVNHSMAGLRGKPTLVLISACYSGSFVEPLAGPSRVILTASAKDRNSFGCQFQSTNTYFIDELFNQPSILDKSVTQLMEQAKAGVAKREIAQKLSPPSLPQMFTGVGVRAWANQPIKDWLKP